MALALLCVASAGCSFPPLLSLSHLMSASFSRDVNNLT
jgi:hypothetical protein